MAAVIRMLLIAAVGLAIGCGPDSKGQDGSPLVIPAIEGTPNDVTILNAVGPGTYSLAANRSVAIDQTVKLRLNTGSPYTDGLNTQLVSVVKAKVNNPSNTAYVSITGLGDSMTVNGDSYRRPINTQLAAVHGSAMALEWEGDFQIGPNTAVTAYSQGRNGATTESAYTNRFTDWGVNVRRPDVIVVQIGTNDALNLSHDATTYLADYKLLVETVHSLLPSARFAVAYVPEMPSNPSVNAIISSYNSGLPGTWTTIETDTGMTLYRATGTDGLVYPDDFIADGIHYNQTTGADKVGAVLGPAVVSAVAAVGKI